MDNQQKATSQGKSSPAKTNGQANGQSKGDHFNHDLELLHQEDERVNAQSDARHLPADEPRVVDAHSKDNDLQKATIFATPELTDNLGHRIHNDQNSLRAGSRGPTLLEDFHLIQKIQHFDHERIPERIVHARGAAAHGYFQVYESMAKYTKAKVLQNPEVQTPVFVRFSTVAGSRGSADTARDVRGFAVKFYTEEGNWDIVGNNIPVFFIQDAIKFPDLIHAVKPEPHNEIPQAASAHDTFWDFISLTPESMHMIMWVMSDRAIPRSFAMMEGFGVHSFRFVNDEGQARFVKFHWKPLLGVHSLVWDEAQKLAGKDADFHRRNMWDSIENGDFLEWELGVQMLDESDEFKFDFDVLDSTKLWPEDLIPVQRIGKMTLNRNPDNYFAETEQVAFATTNIVPGIEFSNDPLLQGRNFSYLDTQLSRLGSPNFTELPINRAVVPVSNNQRDAQMRYTVNEGRVSYKPNSLDVNQPDDVPLAKGGYDSYPERVEGSKVRVRAESFNDHYGQAKLFWNSMTPPEKEHIVKALQFELSKVETKHVRTRMLEHLNQINGTLAAQVAIVLGEVPPSANGKGKPAGTADSDSETAALANATSETTASGGLQQTSGLSQIAFPPANTPQGQLATASTAPATNGATANGVTANSKPASNSDPANTATDAAAKPLKGRMVAVLIAPGVATNQVKVMKMALMEAGAQVKLVAPNLGSIAGDSEPLAADKTYGNTSSVEYDAVYVPGGASVPSLIQMGDARHFVEEAFKHAKPICATGEGVQLLAASQLAPAADATSTSSAKPAASANPAPKSQAAQPGVIVAANATDSASVAQQFIVAIVQHRHWGRTNPAGISA